MFMRMCGCTSSSYVCVRAHACVRMCACARRCLCVREGTIGECVGALERGEKTQ